MPGLWDNHQHFSDVDGPLDLANGVTSARDMANDTDSFLQARRALRRRHRARPARFEGRHHRRHRRVRRAQPRCASIPPRRRSRTSTGMPTMDTSQIKIYSSVKPELVPIIADHAHARGLRVSGHVPAFMSARQFVEGGADEIQHLNFIELNFLFPEVKETRNRDRFIKVAEHAREFTPDKPQVREFIAFLEATSHRARSDDERLRRALLRRPDRCRPWPARRSCRGFRRRSGARC